MEQYAFKKDKIVIYTSIIGNYDELLPIKYADCEHICFTDNTQQNNKGWKLIHVNDFNLNIKNNRRHSRWFKFHATKLFPENKSIWKDGNIILNKSPKTLLEFAKPSGISARPHGARRCIYEEAKAVINLNFANEKKVKTQINKYKKEKFPKNYGLTENCVIARIPNKKVQQLENLIWKEYMNGSVRDQLCVMYAAWKLRIDINTFPRNYYRRKQGHQKERMYQ